MVVVIVGRVGRPENEDANAGHVHSLKDVIDSLGDREVDVENGAEGQTEKG